MNTATKTIDLTETVYELVQRHPEIVDIMAGLGFSEITKKVMLNTVARFTTIPQGAKMRGIDMDKIIRAFEANGFYVRQNRTDQLKGYLKRLNAGEELESVREDFRKAFERVEAAEIMQAEQEMMAEGTPLTEVQRLCDLHSALFHGDTLEERIDNAEKEVAASVNRLNSHEQAHAVAQGEDAQAAAARLSAVKGHPLETFSRENKALEEVIKRAEQALERNEDVLPILAEMRQIAIHYSKKGDLLFPLLKVRYGVSGPSEVMWTVDDEIRDEMGEIVKAGSSGPDARGRAAAVVQRAKEMIFKERKILFPICAANFRNEEWLQIYHDSKDYAVCLGVRPNEWSEGEASPKFPEAARTDGRITLPTGSFTSEELRGVLNTIPMEITFVDADNVNRYFNEGPKDFKRPQLALGRDVFSCHPPKIEVMVRHIIDELRAGKRDKVSVCMNKNGKTELVSYLAVRGSEGEYLGVMELVQELDFAREYLS